VLGDGLAVLAIPLMVLELTRNPLLSGLSAASVTVGYLLVGLPAGVLVDRLDPWRVLIAMDAARAIAVRRAVRTIRGRRAADLAALHPHAVSRSPRGFFESALAVDPLGAVAAGASTAALGGDPRPVFLVAGVTVMGLRRAAGQGPAGSQRPPCPVKPGPGLTRTG
jgi:MFS family permease